MCGGAALGGVAVCAMYCTAWAMPEGTKASGDSPEVRTTLRFFRPPSGAMQAACIRACTSLVSATSRHHGMVEECGRACVLLYHRAS